MSLVIEDGTIVTDAVSYASVAQARAYAAKRGFTALPAADADLEALLVKACDFLQSLEDEYKGDRVDDDQPLAWPRQGVYLFGTTLFADDEIPVQVVQAQCQLACDGVTLTLQPNGTGREVLRQKVDVIETQYAERGSTTVQPDFNKAMGILGPCLASHGMDLRTIRV